LEKSVAAATEEASRIYLLLPTHVILSKVQKCTPVISQEYIYIPERVIKKLQESELRNSV